MSLDILFAPDIPPHTDWRLVENRLEAFSRVCHWRMVEGDLDHHHTNKVIADLMGLDDDTKTLYALIYGQSYRSHWAMIALQLFPDILNYDADKFQEWHDDNWKRLKFAKDTKWGVRKVPAFIQDIKRKFGGPAGLYERLGNIANSGSTSQNYFALNKELQSLFGIGRMTAWLAQQTLYEFFKWDIDHWDQQLYDVGGTWSQMAALAYLFDHPVDKNNVTKDDIKFMENKTIELMEYCNNRIPFHVDIYNIESCECEFRKTAAREPPKEFTGWAQNEEAQAYPGMKELWPEIDWNPYVTGLMTKGKNIRDYGWHPDYFRVFKDHGLNLNTHTIYKDEPNAHEVLSLPKNTAFTKVLYDDWDKIPDHAALQSKFHPVKYLQMKPKDHPAWNDPNVDYGYMNNA